MSVCPSFKLSNLSKFRFDNPERSTKGQCGSNSEAGELIISFVPGRPALGLDLLASVLLAEGGCRGGGGGGGGGGQRH